ncbi:putative nuclease HARBI1 [Strongylocentrotus purpuratus]|uniref:DDE Tnp4 domain-containing protein n=1 Tax=Strongylocentrotus purpuratus TaxID=7668 RepID=A0A7M7RAE5_STRPU|nr:putative nuclease HARBI1 [Strongylocentrotus purpuratus]|eukprot:XP_783499.1 PREDICTED: putative nuclease HARBI1 [Strongylocentrotus purpuratus]
MALQQSSALQKLKLLVRLEEEEANDDYEQGKLLLELHQRSIPRSCWVRSWICRRKDQGQFDQLMRELEDEDEDAFTNFLRVTPQMFKELEQRLHERLEKQDTFFRKALSPALKLAITLRHLATGDSYKSLMYSFRVAHNTISLIVREVCTAIIEEYGDELVKCPTSPQEWKAVAHGFEDRWNSPHTIGALDGKHVAIKCPKDSGSIFYNYKGFYSIVLMALVDANYKFLWVDVGYEGSTSDAQLFNSCELKQRLKSDTLGVPLPEPMTNDDVDTPYFFVADEAFALRTWLMKPYARTAMARHERIYNYRLSRARRVVENAFGIHANRFQCLLTTLRQNPSTVRTMVQACVCLHNLMRTRYPCIQNSALDREDAEHNIVPGSWRGEQTLAELRQPARGRSATQAAQAQRNYIKAYYNSPAGSVPWQESKI